MMNDIDSYLAAAIGVVSMSACFFILSTMI